jgi:hypothetical protein
MVNCASCTTYSSAAYRQAPRVAWAADGGAATGGIEHGAVRVSRRRHTTPILRMGTRRPGPARRPPGGRPRVPDGEVGCRPRGSGYPPPGRVQVPRVRGRPRPSRARELNTFRQSMCAVRHRAVFAAVVPEMKKRCWVLSAAPAVKALREGTLAVKFNTCQGKRVRVGSPASRSVRKLGPENVL